MAKTNDASSTRTTKLTDRASLWVAVFCLSGALLLFLAEPVIQQRLARRGVFTDSTPDSVDPVGEDLASAESNPGMSNEVPGIAPRTEAESPRSMFDAGQSTYSLFWLKGILLVLGISGFAYLLATKWHVQRLE